MLIVLVTIAVGSWFYFSRNPKVLSQLKRSFGQAIEYLDKERKNLFKSLSKKPAVTKKSAQLPAAKPDFKPLLPEGKQPNNPSGKIGYDGTRKVASYKDKIGEVDITISQQPLPQSFQKEPDQELQKLATSISATTALSSTPKAYLGISEKGPQTVVFHKNGLLVFLYAEHKIEDAAWTDYINKLQ